MLLKKTCHDMLVSVSVLLNFEMLQHTTFPTKAEINYRMDVRMCMGSFNFINCLSWGSLPRKKCPVVWLLASEVPKQEAFE